MICQLISRMDSFILLGMTRLPLKEVVLNCFASAWKFALILRIYKTSDTTVISVISWKFMLAHNTASSRATHYLYK